MAAYPAAGAAARGGRQLHAYAYAVPRASRRSDASGAQNRVPISAPYA